MNVPIVWILSLAIAAYAANRNPTHIATPGYGVANIAIRNAMAIKERKLLSLLGSQTTSGYPKENDFSNFFIVVSYNTLKER
jgi:hypothetical protein